MQILFFTSIAILLSFLPSIIFAGIIPTITPLVAYEKETVYLPSKHSEERISYGARARIGWQILGLEASYLQGQYSKNFPDGNKASTDTEKIRVGVSSILGGGLAIEARVGAESRHIKKEVTDSSGAITSSEDSTVVRPYAGGGIQIRIVPFVRFFAGVNYTFIDSDTQIPEYSAGFNIHI